MPPRRASARVSRSSSSAAGGGTVVGASSEHVEAGASTTAAPADTDAGRPRRTSSRAVAIASSQSSPLSRTRSTQQLEEAAAALTSLPEANRKIETPAAADEDGDVDMQDAEPNAGLPSKPPPAAARKSSQRRPKAATKVAAESQTDEVEEKTTPTEIASTPAAVVAAAASTPHRRTSRQAANPKLAVASYAVGDEETDDELPELPEDSLSAAEDSDDAFEVEQDDAYEVQSDAPSEEDDDVVVMDDEEEFTPTDSKRKKKSNKRKPASSAKKPKVGSGVKRPKKDDTPASEVPLEDESGAIVVEDSPPPAASASKIKRPTAAQRKRSMLAQSAAETMTPSQEARDASFRAFATAPVSAKKSTAATPTAAATAVVRSTVVLDDDDDIMEIDPFVPSTNKQPKHAATAAAAASSTRDAASAWSNIGLSAAAAATPASSASGASKPTAKGKVKPLPKGRTSHSSAEKDERIHLVHELLGGAPHVTRIDIVRYLEAADWNAEVAVTRILDSAWFQSSSAHGGITTFTPAAKPKFAATTTPKGPAKPMAIDVDDSACVASSRASAAFSLRKTMSPTKSKPSSPPRDSSASHHQTDTCDVNPSSSSSSSFAPPPVAPTWDRKLLLILTVSALSTTSGKNVLQIGDEVEFIRERFDPLGWSEEQKEIDDAAVNAHAMVSASGPSKKKPTQPKAKGKNNLLQPKKPARILRFQKRGANANSLEIGSVPQILTQLLAPLFDAGFLDLDSSVLYVAPQLDYFSTISLSLSVYVLPALFMWQPPRDATNQAPLSSNPFWSKILAKKDSAAAATSGHRWNPIEAFCTLLRECEVQPIASTEMELDGGMPEARPTPATEKPTEEQKQVEATPAAAAASSSAAAAASSSSATSSSTAAASISDAAGPPAEPVYEEELAAASADPANAADQAEGATISRFQLDSLYASAAVAATTIPEADAPLGFKTNLHPYQRQALYWMKMREQTEEERLGRQSADGEDKPAVRRHPLWEEYAFTDPEDTRYYVNPFAHEISLQFPASTGSCRGGLLCDEMGLGKTAMMLSLILANHPANLILEQEENEQVKQEEAGKKEESKEDADVVDLDDVASSIEAVPAAAAAAASSATPDSKSAAPGAFFDVSSSRAKHRRLYMNHNGVVGATLVVCPMSLLSQWRNEVAKFTNLDVHVYYGAAKDRRKVDFSLYDVVLTSYGIVAAENRTVVQAQSAANAAAIASGSMQTPLSDQRVLSLSPLIGTNFWRIVLDEGHIIRQRTTETAKAIFALRGERRWSVSGTIIQNRIDDVFAPLHFLKEEPWSSWGWWSTVISQPFEKQDPVALQRLRAVLGPLMLRRTKAMRTATGESIVELPPRVDETLQVEFSDEERDFYTALYNRSRTQFEGFVSAGTATSKYIQILTLLLRLRQACCHPYLVLGKEKTDKDFEADINRFIHRFVSRVDLRAEGAPTIQFLETLTSDLKKRGATEGQECSICLCPPETPVLTECAHCYCRDCLNPLFNDRGLARCPLCRSVIDVAKLFLVPEAAPPIRIDAAANWKHSSKTRKLIDELRAVRDGQDPTAKVVIFSQWTSMLDLIEIPLKQEKFDFLRLDGALTQKEREIVLRKFDKDAEARILLISLKAGGVGLNLVRANYCYLFDIWWNPSCHANGTLVALADGRDRPVEQLAVGDTLLDPCGEPVKVLGVQANMYSPRMFRIDYEGSRGKFASSHTVTPEHLVTLRWNSEPRTRIATQERLAANGTRVKDSMITLEWFERTTLTRRSERWRFTPIGRDPPPPGEVASHAARSPKEIRLPLQADAARGVRSSLSGMTIAQLRAHILAWLADEMAYGRANPMRRGDLFELQAARLFELKATLIDQPKQHVRMPMLSMERPQGGAFLPASPNAQPIAAVGRRGSSVAVGEIDGQTKEDATTQANEAEDLDSHLGSESTRGPASLLASVLQSHSSEPILATPSAVIDDAHLELFRRTVELAHLAKQDGGVCEEFSQLVVAREGQLDYVPIAGGQTIKVAYMLPHGWAPSATKSASGCKAYAISQLERAWQQLGIAAGDAGIMMTQLNPLTGPTGSIDSRLCRYDAVCRASMTATLSTGVCTILALGRDVAHRWWHDAHRLPGVHSVDRSKRDRLVLQLANRQVTVLRCVHPSCGWRFASVLTQVATAHGLDVDQEALERTATRMATTRITGLTPIGGSSFTAIQVAGATKRFVLSDGACSHNCEEQAIQRIHRIGQVKPVFVKRFIVRGSVEERILELQEKKKHLAQSVSADAEQQKQVRMQDLVDLFRTN